MSTHRRTPKHSSSEAHLDGGESASERASRVARLRWAVQAGAYDPDPEIIAAFMLCGPRAILGPDSPCEPH
ncbi:MAG: flagellar biosynthesis anti-sigma factor FlgM [Deltaproteobacteria bacterium]|nr:flagellar biosynthesis anti-sigma factor FlgM [Deltaproteobacteria bacterium]